MAAKHDQSSTNNNSTTITNTSTQTSDISDSYNTTKSYVSSMDNVGNTTISNGGEGIAEMLGLDQASIGGGIDWQKTGVIAGIVLVIAIALGLMFRR